MYLEKRPVISNQTSDIRMRASQDCTAGLIFGMDVNRQDGCEGLQVTEDDVRSAERLSGTRLGYSSALTVCLNTVVSFPGQSSAGDQFLSTHNTARHRLDWTLRRESWCLNLTE